MPVDDQVESSSTLWATELELGAINDPSAGVRRGQNQRGLVSVQARDSAAPADWTLYFVRDREPGTSGGILPVIKDIRVYAGAELARAELNFVDATLLVKMLSMGSRGIAIHITAPTVNAQIDWTVATVGTIAVGDKLRAWIARGRPARTWVPFFFASDPAPEPNEESMRIPTFATGCQVQWSPSALFAAVPTTVTAKWLRTADTSTEFSSTTVVLQSGGFSVPTVELAIPPEARFVYFSSDPAGALIVGRFEVVS